MAKKPNLQVMTLIHQLRHIDTERRREAIEELIVLKAKEAAQAVAVCLQDKNPTIRALAAKALGILGDDSVVSALIEALGDEDENVNYWIVFALTRMKSEELFEKIEWALTDEKLAKYAFSIVGKLEGIGIDKVISLLSHPSWNIRSLAAEALIEIGELSAEKVKERLEVEENIDAIYWLLRVLGKTGNEESVETIKKFVESEEADIRKAAVEALYNLGNYESVLLLKDLLSSKFEDVRFLAVSYLGDFGLEYLEQIIGKFEDKSWIVRDAASRAAAKSGREVLPIFESLLLNGSDNQRFCALKTLSYFGEDGLNSLLLALDDPFWAIRRMASDKLVSFGPKVVPVLVKHLVSKKSSDEKKFWIIRALGKIQDNSVVGNLVKFLNYPNKDIRFATVKALARIGDKSIVTRLIDSLAFQSEEGKYWSIKTLGQLGKEAIESLMKKLSDPNWNVRRTASEALGEIGEEAIEFLLEGLKDENKDVRYWSHKALVKIGYKAADGVMELLKHPKWYVRKEAAETLQEMGPQVIPKMMVGLRSHNEHYQYWIPKIIGAMKFKVALRELKEFLRKGTKEERIIAIRAIGEIGILEDDELKKMIVDSLADEFWEVRIEAAKTVGILKIKEASEALLENVLDSDPKLRANAALSLGLIGIEEASNILMDLLEDVDHRVKSCAIKALGYLKPKNKELVVSKLLEIIFYYDQPDIQKAIIWTLGELKVEKAVNTLIKIFGRDSLLEKDIVEALGKFSSPEAFDFIEKVLLNEKKGTQVRIKALETYLKNAPQEKIEEILKKLMEDKNFHIRKFAFKEMYRFNLASKDKVEEIKKKYGKEKKEYSLYRRGLRYLKNKNLQLAISSFLEAIEKNPQYKEPYLKLIQLFTERNLLDQAKKMALKFLKHFPNNEYGLLSLGYIFFQEGDYKKAKRFLKDTLKVATSSANITIAKKMLKKIEDVTKKS